MMTYWWLITAFQAKGPSQLKGEPKGDYTTIDQVIIELEAKTEEEALNKAKRIIKRKYYRVANVKEWEKHDLQLDDEMRMTALKQQNEMIKTMKGLTGE